MAFKTALKIEKGRHYYVVTCPNTQKTLWVAIDPSDGAERYSTSHHVTEGLTVPCDFCYVNHPYDVSEVRSLQAAGEG